MNSAVKLIENFASWWKKNIRIKFVFVQSVKKVDNLAHETKIIQSSWEEAGSAENPITIDEDELFSETMTPQNPPPQQPPAMEPRSALRSKENLQISRQLFD